jgi:hypothetical protein
LHALLGKDVLEVTLSHAYEQAVVVGVGELVAGAFWSLLSFSSSYTAQVKNTRLAMSASRLLSL